MILSALYLCTYCIYVAAVRYLPLIIFALVLKISNLMILRDVMRAVTVSLFCIKRKQRFPLCVCIALLHRTQPHSSLKVSLFLSHKISQLAKFVNRKVIEVIFKYGTLSD